MEIDAQMILSLFVVMLIITLFVRTKWVYNHRKKISYDCYYNRMKAIGDYNAGNLTDSQIYEIANKPWDTENYLSFNGMMLRFWIWNIDKLKLN